MQYKLMTREVQLAQKSGNAAVISIDNMLKLKENATRYLEVGKESKMVEV